MQSRQAKRWKQPISNSKTNLNSKLLEAGVSVTLNMHPAFSPQITKFEMMLSSGSSLHQDTDPSVSHWLRTPFVHFPICAVGGIAGP